MPDEQEILLFDGEKFNVKDIKDSKKIVVREKQSITIDFKIIELVHDNFTE